MDAELWIALFTLSTLEIVLGVDNLVFISIAVSRLPAQQRPLARKLGLAFACLTRIALLVTLAYFARMDDKHMPLFRLFGKIISVRDIILGGGGVFLIVKGIMEIVDAIRGKHAEVVASTAAAGLAWVIAQIAIIDIVFSIDSVITAVGMVDELSIMIAAVVASVGVMMFAARPIGEFVHRHPSVKVLALAFLNMVGLALIAEAFEVHVPKGYIYSAMVFSLAVEFLNIRARSRRLQRAAS